MKILSIIFCFFIQAHALPLWGSGGLHYFIIHCSAVRPNQTSSAKQIDQWHRARGWRMIGYHYVIRRDGTVEPGRPLWMVGAHCKGHNTNSIGICYEGGLDARGQPADTRTPEQKASMDSLVNVLHIKYPVAQVVGHNHFARKACPCYETSPIPSKRGE